jgi:hypothetical protein
VKAIRLVRFRGFADSGWIELRPLTLLFGHNSSGKSSVLAALLMLRQSLLNPDRGTPFLFSGGDGVDLGTFEDAVYGRRPHPREPIEIHVRVEVPDPGQDWPFLVRKELILALGIAYDAARRTLRQVRYRLYDDEDRTILDFQRSTPRPGGTWTVRSSFFPGKQLPTPSELRWDHFLPDFPQATRAHPSLLKLTRTVNAEIAEALRALVHIGPLRTEPVRFYYFTGESAASVGRRGESTYKLLAALHYQGRITELQDAVNRWLERLGYSLDVRVLGKSPLVQIGVREGGGARDGLSLNLVDVGFGISQVLPLLVQSYGGDEGRLILLEQPELHLHPRAQADLGDLLREVASRNPLLVESHSEHLLLRLRRRIAEFGAGSVRSGLSRDHVGVYFVERSSGMSRIARIELDDLGQLQSPPKAFQNFFADDYVESLEIQKLVARKRRGQAQG